jgi:thioredoxin reductase
VTLQRTDAYDVVVVGGGAAGLGGALLLARARRSVLVVDAGQPRNAVAAGVHGFLSREGTSPAALLEAGRAEVRGYGGEILAARVRSVSRQRDGFEVALEDGGAVGARRLLVTTGLVDELPDVPGVRERWAARSCTARTAMAGRSAIRPSASWRRGRCRCTRHCCSGSGRAT